MKIITYLMSFFGLLFVGIFVYLWRQIPSETQIKGCLVTTMYQVHLCPGSKKYTPLKSISKYLQKTVILSEDSNFFGHKGIDWEALEKSARENLEKGSYRRGGSTITQQLAKNMFLYKEKTIFRKFIEALIAIKIERTLTKNEILERYLNVVEFGKNIYGIEAAAQFYFKKSPADLSLTESAFLTMLLPSPIKYARSFHNKELTHFARNRVKKIVEDMFRYHRISEAEYSSATSDLDYFLTGIKPPQINPEDEENENGSTDENSDENSDDPDESENEDLFFKEET